MMNAALFVPKPAGFQAATSTVVAATLAISVLSLALPVTTLQVYDRLLPNQSAGTLTVLVIGVALAMSLEFVLRLARAYLVGLSGAAYVHGLSCMAVKHLLGADVGLADREGRNIDFQSLSAIRNLKDFHNGHSLGALTELAFVPVFLGIIAYIAGLLVLIPLILLAGFAIFSLLGGLNLRAALARREEHDDQRYNFLIRSLNTVHSVKAFALEQSLMRRYEGLQGESCIANFSVSEIMTRSLNSGALFAQAMTAITIGVGALAVIDGRITVGTLIAVVLLSGRIMQPIQRGLVLWVRYQDFTVSRQKVARIFEIPAVIAEANQEIPSNDGRLVIENLSFAYGDTEPTVIDGLSLTLSKGEAISIAGAQGCGKSTLLRLIAGLHRPLGGTIEVNGLETTRFPPRHLSEHIALMSTDGTIFRGTIRDNITGFGEIPAAQAMVVASLLGVDEEIAKLPSGLETRLEGNGADSIPPGFKQRLALIRVLATKPRILLFDGADRALDLEGYRRMNSLIARLKSKTAMILVTDDENLKVLADKHFELVDGRLRQAKAGARDRARPYRQLRI